MKIAALVTFLFGAWPAIAEEPPVIGRLFAPAGFSATGGDAIQSPSLQRIRVDGAVIRSSGKNTIWLNGEPLTENSRAPIAAHADLASLPSVRIRDSRTGATAQARAGEESELGEVSTSRPAPAGGRAK